MPFLIQTGNQSFSSSSAAPAVQSWFINPSSVYRESLIVASPNPVASQDIMINLRDYLNSSFSATYNSFVLNVSVEQPVNTVTSIFSITSSTHDITAPIALDASNVMLMELNLDFLNETSLLQGLYQGDIVLSVSATNVNTSLASFIEEKRIPIELERNGFTNSVVTPRSVDLTYLKGPGNGSLNSRIFTIIPSITQSSVSPIWVLRSLAELDINITGATVLPSAANEVAIGGSGLKGGTVELSDHWETIDEGRYTSLFEVGFSGDSALLGVNVNVTVFDLPGIIVDPVALEFYAQVSEIPAAQSLSIHGTAAFTIIASPWLNISSTIGVLNKTITVVPVATANFSEGIHTGSVDILLGNIVVSVPVTFTVTDGLETSLVDNGLNFTMDDNYITVSGYSSLFTMQIKTAGQVYNSDNASFDFSDSIKVPFINDLATYKIGSLIHQAMRWVDVDALQLNDPAIAAITGRYPQQAVVNFEIIVYDEFGAVVLERELNNYVFVPGVTPLNAFDMRGILSYQERVSRITQAGYHLFNVFNHTSGNVTLYVNDQPVQFFNFANNDQPFNRILIKGFDYEIGDRVSIKITGNPSAFIVPQVQEYVIIYPPQEYSRTIAFVTYYNTIEYLECTGQLLANSPYTTRANTTIVNNVDVIKIVDTLRSDQLIINTGWAGEDQRTTIDLLKRCRKAWLLVDGKSIELSPNPQVFEHSDTERFLHNYELQFNINRKTDAQIHLF